MNKLQKWNNWFWGIIFICVAGLILTDKTYLFGEIGVMKLLITLILLSSIVKSIPYRNFFGVLVPGAVLYIMYARYFWWALPFNGWSLIWAAVFASIGLSFLFRPETYRYFHHQEWTKEPGYGPEEKEERYYE